MDQQSEERSAKKINPIRYIIYNIVGLVLVLIIHHVSPTNLAGPGLDILFMLTYSVLSFLLMLLSSRYLAKDISYPSGSIAILYVAFTVNLLGFIFSIVLWCIPANIW
jgi:hypothetical protein